MIFQPGLTKVVSKIHDLEQPVTLTGQCIWPIVSLSMREKGSKKKVTFKVANIFEHIWTATGNRWTNLNNDGLLLHEHWIAICTLSCAFNHVRLCAQLLEFILVFICQKVFVATLPASGARWLMANQGTKLSPGITSRFKDRFNDMLRTKYSKFAPSTSQFKDWFCNQMILITWFFHWFNSVIKF